MLISIANIFFAIKKRKYLCTLLDKFKNIPSIFLEIGVLICISTLPFQIWIANVKSKDFYTTTYSSDDRISCVVIKKKDNAAIFTASFKSLQEVIIVI